MTDQSFHLRTTENPPKYVHSVQGITHVTWVTEQDKAHAAVFPGAQIADWRRVVSGLAGCNLVSELPSSHMIKVEMKFFDPEPEEKGSETTIPMPEEVRCWVCGEKRIISDAALPKMWSMQYQPGACEEVPHCLMCSTCIASFKPMG